MKIRLVAFALCIGLCSVGHESLAQFDFFKKLSSSSGRKNQNFTPYSVVSIGGGHANYYGEFASYRQVLPALSNIRWNATASYTRHFSQRFSARIGLTWIRLFGDDYNFKNDATKQLLFLRNLHFRNDVKELSILGVYDLVNGGKNFQFRTKLVPYLFGGVAVFAHNPEAKAPVDFGGAWTDLKPLRTEGQGLPGYATPYSLVQLAVPMGIGVRYKLNNRFDIAAELGFRITFTDYLDDTGGNYPNPNDLESDLARAMSNRSLEQIAAYSGGDRTANVRNYLVNNFGFPANGDPFAQPLPTDIFGNIRGTSTHKDAYLISTIQLRYIIAGKVKCPGRE
ncbi:MAG: DUF6089 family protein [Spirosomataceae bacterium]